MYAQLSRRLARGSPNREAWPSSARLLWSSRWRKQRTQPMQCVSCSMARAGQRRDHLQRATWHATRHPSCDAVGIPNVEHANCPIRQHTSAPHESWRAQRRYAASIGALMAQNPNRSTTNSKLAADNLALAAQCSAGVNAAATSDASLQDGSRWKCTRTRAYASPRSDAHTARLGPTCEYSEYPRVSTQSTPL